MHFEFRSVVSFCMTQHNLHGQEFVHDLGILLRDYNDGFGIILNKYVNMSLERHNGFFEPLGSFFKWFTNNVYFGNVLIGCFPTVGRYQAAFIGIRIRTRF